MRIVLQRVTSASVKVDGETIGKIGRGFLILLGVGHDDTEEDCRRLADKISGLRIFSDENDKINLDLEAVGGSLLVVPQFTLYADCRKGNRPSFFKSGDPAHANELYEYILSELRNTYKIPTESGEFGADMKVSLINDGPFTIMLDSDDL